MRANDAALPFPAGPVEALAESSLERAVTMLYYRAVYAAWSERGDPRTHRDEDMLARLLEEKQRRALERVFRALHILEPEHEYATIFDAVREGGVSGAGGREILTHLIEGRVRDGVLALVEPGEPLERLREAQAFFAPEGADRLLAILHGDARDEDLPESARATLDVLAHELFERALQDSDPILVSAVRRRLREGAPKPLQERFDG
jgi:hypothetical protein